MAKKTSKKKVAKKTVRKSAAKKSAKKTTTKKSVSKTATKTSSKEANNTWMLILGIIIVIAGAVLIMQNLSSPLAVSEPDVAATVNGVDITTSQLNTQYAILPDVYKQQYTKRMVLDQLIDEEIILSYAKEQGVEVNSEQVNEEIQSILGTGALTVAQLQENLDRFNFTIEDFELLIERKLYIEKGTDILLEDLVLANDAEVRAYYDANEAEFLMPRQVHVRHILVASQRENAAVLAKDLKERVEAGADFCKLVEENTDDKGSLDACGEYTFGRGFMVPEFEATSFELEPGEVTVVQTAFGYHVIEKLEDIPAQTTPFSEVEEQIRASLNQGLRAKEYSDFITEQKSAAEIEIFI